MHIKTIFAGNLQNNNEIGCGECQTSCQSACKTSCTVANQNCEQQDILNLTTLNKNSKNPLDVRIRKTSSKNVAV